MHVHPAIAALRSDLASQRGSQAAMEAALTDWQSGDAAASVRRDLARFGRGVALTELSVLSALISDHVVASNWADQFCKTFISAIQSNPLGEVPMRHSSSAGFARLQLMQSGRAVLSLSAYEPADTVITPQSAQFADVAMHEILITGSARGAFHSLENGEGREPVIISSDRRWSAGDLIVRRARLDTRHFIEVEQSVLILGLSRTSQHSAPSRVFRLDDGALIQEISGEKRASEQVMALAVLGALDHHSAIGPMEIFAQDPSHDLDARWEAVRQVLAMDTARGMKLLSGAADCANDPMARYAKGLRAQLWATQPALRPSQKELT